MIIGNLSSSFLIKVKADCINIKKGNCHVYREYTKVYQKEKERKNLKKQAVQKIIKKRLAKKEARISPLKQELKSTKS